MTGYAPRLPPRAHQAEALRRSRGRRYFAYLMDMGTGKSKTCLDEFGEMELAREVDDLLIWAPAGCYSNWTTDKGPTVLSEVRKHFSEDLLDRAVVATYRSGGGAAEKKQLERLLATRGRPRVLAVNVEAMSNVRRAIDLCSEFLGRRRAMCVVDESPSIKNPSADRTKTVINLGQLALYRRIASGLVAPNSPMDLFSQFEFLDWRILGQKSFFGFRSRYAIMKKITTNFKQEQQNVDREEALRLIEAGETVTWIDDDTALFTRRTGGRETNIIVGYKNQTDLRARIEHHSFRVRKDECLDLPPKIYMVPRDVELTDEQRRVYAELKKRATAMLDSGEYVSVQMKLTLMMRLHQVLCGHVRDEEGTVRPVKSQRVDELLEVLGGHQRKGVIWTNYDYSVREIVERVRMEFGERSVAAFWGGNKSVRGQEEERFLGDPDCRFIVSTQASGGRGNTWTVADLTVYYSSDYNLDYRAQSEDRTHRDGQTMPCTYVDLCASGTVDEKILRALREKIDLAAVLNGDEWREWVV